MRRMLLLLLYLLWFLIEVHSQTAPYVTFMGETLPNHSFVDLSLVGIDTSNSVKCRTDLDTCCSVTEGLDRGDWYPPDSEMRLPFQADGGDIYESRGPQQVSLHRRNSANMPSGIYRCDIETNAVQSNDIMDTATRETVYVGLYASGGDLAISGEMLLTVDSGASPQFTLTCISTGGPATNVTWTRNSEVVTEGTVTVLDNRVTAQYTHTLILTGRLGGLYTCTVSNNKPSSNSVEFSVQLQDVYLTLNYGVIPNHGYVNISDIGSTDDTALICHTNYIPSGGGKSGGDWVGSDGTAVGDRFSDEHAVPGFRRSRASGVIRLIRYTTNRDPSLDGMALTPPEGIYHCEIEDASLTQQMVFVGLYNSGGDVTIISDDLTFTLDSDLNEISVQFTLACISTGGPATTVTWSRDSEKLTGSTVLNDALTAQYTHNLIVTGRLGGLYTCAVSNDKPSQDSAELRVQAPSPPSALSVSQNKLNSVLVSWTPPSGEPAVTGYVIYYQQDGEQRYSVNAEATATTATITGLMEGATYSIIMVATSSTLPSTVTTIETVTLEPATIYLSSSPSSIVMAGDTVSLTCSVTLPTGVIDTPEFRWEGGGVTSIPTTRGQIVTSLLTLSDIATSQAGQYTCTATLNGSSVSTVTYLTVQIPVPTPSIIASRNTDTLYAGTTLSLTCDHTLSPSVDTATQTAVTWMVNGTIMDTSHGHISTDGDSLSFSPLAISDTGNYTCELTVTTQLIYMYVSVQEPVQSAVEDITVEALPDPLVGTLADSIVTAGDLYTVYCVATSTPYLAIQPTVELIGPGGSVLAATDMSLMVSHTLDPVMTSHAGQYTCMASVMIASVGVDVSAQNSSNLTVQIPQPGVDVSLDHTAPLYAGTSLTLTCTVTLDPNVDNSESVMTEWSGPRDIPGESYSVTAASGSGSTYTGSLTISPLAHLDDGTYTCTVSVTGGTNVLQANTSDNTTVTIMNLPSPIVSISPASEAPTAGQAYSLTCSVLVVQHLVVEPSIVWTRQDGRVVNASSGSSLQLNFNTVKTSNGSRYSCAASVNVADVVSVSGENSRDLVVVIPLPSVTIIRSHNESVFAGTEFVLSTDISFSDLSGVDVNMSLDISWSSDSDVINNSRTAVSPVSGSGDNYTASLTYTPVATSDSGQVTATVTVNSADESVYIQTVSANVTEMLTVEDLPDPVVTISGPTTGTAGENFQLTCSVSVVEYLIAQPTVQWSGGSVDTGNGVTQSDTTHSGVMSMRTLTFTPLRTSHGAQYTCQADINISSISVMKTVSDNRDVLVRIPIPEVVISPPTEPELVSGSPLSLTCSIRPRGGSSVDTPGSIMSNWDAPNDRENVTANDSHVELVIFSVETADTGSYICSASVKDSSDSVYIVHSQLDMDTVYIIVKLNVTISADYTAAPDEDPEELGPNEFTAGGLLSLNCVVQGYSGELMYAWSVMGNPSTTCRWDGCAIDVSSTTSTMTVGNPPLHSYYAGTYTCTVSETGRPDSGNSADYTVAVVGAGIYARRAASQFDDSPIANNGLVVSGDDILIDCISNSSQSDVGTITGPDGSIPDFRPFKRPGVLRLGATHPSPGIYTCTIPDSNNNQFAINVGVYPTGYSMAPTISSLNYQEESHTLTCDSTGSPATIVSWMKDGQPLTIDGSAYHLNQTITDRSSSTYSNVLTVSETATTSVAGTYICNVTNDLGSHSSEVVAVGIAFSGLEQSLRVGQSATISCVANLLVSSIRIYELYSLTVLNSTTNQAVVEYAIPLVTDILQGLQLTCEAVAGTAIYTETVEMQVVVPPGSLEVEVSEVGSLEAGSTNFTLTCTVHETILGITNMPSAHWMGPSGPVTSGEDIVVTETFSNDTTATLTLAFSSLRTSHAGEYMCQGTVVTAEGVEDVTNTSVPNNVTVSLPTPTMHLSVPSGTLYEGTLWNSTCNVTLPDAVDTDVTVDVQWSPVASNDHVMVSAVSSTRPPFISTLTLSPLSISDGGQYSCEATADSSSQYITASSQGQSQVEPLAVMALPAPVVNISFSGYPIAGQNYSLQCSASVVADLVVLPDLKIAFPNSSEIHVLNSSSLEYMFSPLKASDGGQYTCTATINIPQAEITDLYNSVKDAVVVVAAYPVEEFEATVTTQTSFIFFWSPPSIAAHLTMGYRLMCTPLLKGISIPEALMLGPTATTATVTGLHFGVTYNCSIFTIGSEGSSQPQTLTRTTAEIAPEGAPETFEVFAGQRQVVFSWSPPVVTLRNGVITSYTLSCSPSPSSLPQSPSQSGPLTVAGFSPDTSYSCSVVANNSQGSGPSAHTTFSTLQDFAIFQLRLSGLISTCSDLVSTDRNEKLKDITNAVLEELTLSCTDCGITSDIIDRQSFACYPKSPTYVTYRARLEGTPETDSGSLISLIEKWVSSKASIIVTGVLMTVDTGCSVAISSLSEEECSPTQPPTTEPTANNSTTTTDVTSSTVSPSPHSSTDNTAIIIGVVAVVLIIAIMVVVVAIVTLKILRRRRGDLSINRAEGHVMTALPRPPATALTTTSNTAYGLMKKEQGGEGEGGEGGFELIRSPLVDSGSSKYMEVTYDAPESTYSRQLQPLPAAPTSGGVGRMEDAVYEHIPACK